MNLLRRKFVNLSWTTSTPTVTSKTLPASWMTWVLTLWMPLSLSWVLRKSSTLRSVMMRLTELPLSRLPLTSSRASNKLFTLLSNRRKYD
ncbi:hypothetical protein ACHAWC_005990 [Mediolabrus comicus]